MKRPHRQLFGFTACAALLAASGCGSDTSAGGGSIVFTASGEALALGGYDFPFSEAGFVDGWEVKFTALIVTVDKITLSENPDRNPGLASEIGALVAQVDGPWAIDLHKGGPLMGKGGADEQAVQIATID